eukprot:gene14745-31335_t
MSAFGSYNFLMTNLELLSLIPNITSAGLEYGSFGGGSSFNDGFGGSSMYGGGMDPMGGGAFDASGGFMNSNEPKSNEKKTNRDKQSITPLPINQLLRAHMEDDVFKINEDEIHIARIIGNIESVDPQSTSMSYRIGDGTGVIECKVWVEKDGGATSKQSRCSEGSVVKVHGVLRQFEGAVHLLVYDMVPLDDFNELTHHLLECIYVRLQQARGPLPSANTKGGSMPMQTSHTPISNTYMSQSSFNSNVNMDYSTMKAQSSRLGYGTNYIPRPKSIQINIISENILEKVIKAYLTGLAKRAACLGAHDRRGFIQKGLGVNDAYQELNFIDASISKDIMVRAVEILCENGLIYEAGVVNNDKFCTLTNTREVEELTHEFIPT